MTILSILFVCFYIVLMETENSRKAPWRWSDGEKRKKGWSCRFTPRGDESWRCEWCQEGRTCSACARGMSQLSIRAGSLPTSKRPIHLFVFLKLLKGCDGVDSAGGFRGIMCSLKYNWLRACVCVLRVVCPECDGAVSRRREEGQVLCVPSTLNHFVAVLSHHGLRQRLGQVT